MADDKKAQEEAARLLGPRSPLAPGAGSPFAPGPPSFDPPRPLDITAPNTRTLDNMERSFAADPARAIKQSERSSGKATVANPNPETANPMHAKDRRFWLAILWAGSIGGALAVGCYIAWASGQMPLQFAAPGIAIGLLAMAGASIYAFEKRPSNVWRPGPILLGIAALTWALVGWQTWMFFHWPSDGASVEKWAPLTSSQAEGLASRVRFIPPEDIVVACETRNCKDLADGIADILQKTPAWKVSILHRGGLDITGVTGIRLNPNEPATAALKDAIEATTGLAVTLGPDSRKDIGSNQSFLVVGARPF